MGNPLDTSALPLVQAREELAALCRAALDAGRVDDACTLAAALARLVEQQRDGILAVDESLLVGEAHAHAFAATGRGRARVDTLGERAPYVAYGRHLVDEALARAREAIAVLAPLAAESTAHQDERAIAVNKTLADRHMEIVHLAPGGDEATRAEALYERARELAAQVLPPTHPLRLGIILNYVVCMYETLAKHKQAIDVAKHAFDEAIARLDQLEEAATGHSSKALMQALKDRLAAWTAEQGSAS